MDTLGRRGIARAIRAAGAVPPPRDELQAIALIGDVASNGLMYALVGLASPGLAPVVGLAIGTAAGLGSLALPPVLELGPGRTNWPPRPGR